eukprot:GFYU01027154.1.p1 GENE.GFYU01027154.1~~GFYU01027154.1.p1  ORF type:complete len:606 (+),score=229.56 GFYU01027154.1:242-1819(+)
MVMDHRQLNHFYGPWIQLPGSYAEPIAGDENPETYGVPIQSLHVDHVAAFNMRRINYIYAEDQLIPAARVPGFTGHQTERSNTQGQLPYSDYRLRDFDLLAYRYSFMSNIGTAGLNSVWTMIPARDEEEFKLFPQEELAFMRQWYSWADANVDTLKHTAPIRGAPGFAFVDGTAAIKGNEGFVFLFNSGLVKASTTSPDLRFDESMNLANGTYCDVQRWLVSEIYPSNVIMGFYSAGDLFNVELSGWSARVFQLTDARTVATKNLLVGLPGDVSITDAGATVSLTNVEGEKGTKQSLQVLLQDGTTKAASVTTVLVNGNKVAFHVEAGTNTIVVDDIQFDGTFFPTQAQIAMTQGDHVTMRGSGVSDSVSYHGEFTVPAQLLAQLNARQQSYPIEWNDFDVMNCGWLAPQRLLLYISIAAARPSIKASVSIDGTPATIQLSYTSRMGGDSHASCFTGFYVDLTGVVTQADKQHTIELTLDNMEADNKLIGVYWDTAKSEVTDKFTTPSATTYDLLAWLMSWFTEA